MVGAPRFERGNLSGQIYSLMGLTTPQYAHNVVIGNEGF